MNNNNLTFSTTNGLFPTIEEVLKKIDPKPDPFMFHVLSCRIIPSYFNTHKLFSFEPGTYFAAIHNPTDNQNSGLMCYVHPMDCISKTSSSSATADTMEKTTLNIYVTDKKKIIQSSTISAGSTIHDLKEKIKQLFGDVNYNNFSLFEGKSLNFSLQKKINELENSYLLISKVKYEKCSSTSIGGDSLPLVDYTFDVGPIEECMINFVSYSDPYAIQASPCGHKFSVDGFFKSLTQSTMKEMIALNTNEETKKMYDYLILCPCCRSDAANRGAVTTNAARIHPYVYSLATRWSTIANYISQGGVFCGLSTHVDDVPYFMPEESGNVMKVCMNMYESWMIFLFSNSFFFFFQVFCKVCDAFICRKHGSLWKVGRCDCIPGSSIVILIVIQIEKILIEGSYVRCPGCNTPIRKRDACTHMRCTRPNAQGFPCDTQFCLFCGIEIGVNGSYLMDHNEDWEVDKTKCVWFLEDHPLLSDDDITANEDFHYYRTLRLLKKAKEENCQKYGRELWDQACELTKHLLVNPPYDYIKGLSSNKPNPADYTCRLP